jgi:hypothetical protein
MNATVWEMLQHRGYRVVLRPLGSLCEVKAISEDEQDIVTGIADTYLRAAWKIIHTIGDN